MTKPSKLPEWDTTQVNSIEPDQPHKDEGWLAPGGIPEKPPFQTFNYWQNEVYRWLNEINIAGILAYDASTNYVAGISYIIGSDGNLYICWENNGPTTAIIDPVGDATGVWSLFETNIYRVDASETDQGVTGNGRTIKAYVDAIGTSKKATLIITHNGIANTTAYTLTTSETIPSNITLKIENGAIFTGVGTLIQNGAFEAGLYQTFEPTFKVRFGPGVLKTATPQLWGAQGIGVTFDDSAAIDALFDCLMSSDLTDGGFSSWELANETPGAAITGPSIFFPPGDYNYNGSGITWATDSHRTLIMKAMPGTVRIRIADGIYLITYELADNTFIEGINFYGGKGAIKYNSTAGNVRGRHYIQHCWFSYYTECAIGNLSSDMPYMNIKDNTFYGRAGENTIGIALGGYLDAGELRNNFFLRNKYHIKIGGDTLGISGNFYIGKNSFLSKDTGTDKIADIWIVPNDTDAMGVNSGLNFRIEKNKFGNENQQIDDIRILVARENTGVGTDRLNYQHSTTWDTTGDLTGLAICDNLIQGSAGITAPFIYSYCKNLLAWRFHDNLFSGGIYKYIVEFNGNLDGDGEQTLWSIRGGLSITGNNTYQKVSNEPLGIVNDPYLFMGGDIATINNYPTIGDDLGYASRLDAAIRTTGGVANCTRANVADFYGGIYASTLTYTAADGYWGSAVLSALTERQPGWIEVDIKQSASNPISYIKIALFNFTTGMIACRRLVHVPADWRTIRIPFVAPEVGSGSWQLMVYGTGYVAGETSVDVGRPKVYQAHQAVNSGHLQIIGTTTGAGKWDGAHMIMGTYHLWIDATGDLRIKSSAPASDTDGAVVGAQT